MISLKKKKHNVYSRYVIPLIKTKLRSIYLIILSDNKNEKLILLENISFLHFPPILSSKSLENLEIFLHSIDYVKIHEK